MPLQSETKSFLSFLRTNPAIRVRIRAAPSQTMLYAGTFMRPAWREIAQFRRTHPANMKDKETLPDVLAKIPVPGTGFRHLLEYSKNVEGRVPWKPDGFIVWRALSGIFAGNAVGAVSFCILSDITPADKVFAATELSVLMRNPKIDAKTRDLLEYYRRCIQNKTTAINVGFISA